MQGDFRIGDRTIVPTLNQILHSGTAVHVEPKVMRVLLHLAARRGEVARREELMQEVWPHTFVTDDVLKRCISDLRKALGDDRQKPRFIDTIPKVGYRLIPPVEPAEPQGEGERDALPVVPATTTPRRTGQQKVKRALAAAAIVLLGAVAGATLWRVRWRQAPPAPRVVLLSAERLVASGALSPDGTQIVFSSPGDAGDNWDIWLKIVGEAEVRRLTTNEKPDFWPSWAPDGKQIAFVRLDDAGIGTIYMVSPIGGPERRLPDPPVGRTSVSWSPDGQWLAAAKASRPSTFFGTGIYLIPTAGGAARQVTSPQASTFDMAPAFSPDGSVLAYASCEGAEPGFSCDVWTLSLDAEARPHGKPRRLTRQGFWATTLAWTRDGGSIVYGANAGRFSRLWRIRADGSAGPERVEVAGLGAVSPSTVRCCDRLAYVRNMEDADIYRFEPGAGAASLIASAVYDFNPQYSPDGRRIAFESSRADERNEIWLANADGSAVTRLTRGPSLREQGSPRWSPDGRTIAFDSQAANGRWDIWTIDVDGSGLRQITRDPADENMPSWSRDGRFVYYGSNRTGRYEIWRVASGGGSEKQLTHNGGFLPIESLDGRTLYYLRARGGALLARPTAGGEERSIVPCIDTWAYAVGPRGVLHVDCPTPGTAADTPRPLRDWDEATGRDREIALLDVGSGPILGLSVSPDGSVLYSRYTPAFQLMMVEDFR
jgi:Tol biopolymer transport system component/DNA-binding winged helix-turn-helix (wHTH) protein